ncbi:MAG: glycosyltransferase family 2 protein [Actinomycetales bacterium]|nr:glycosyltransferase family 2 protein [Actinomycetales bacterium]
MTGQSPPVTVIMPVLNEERHLPHAVQQVLEQDYRGRIELVIAVGPSTDRTRAVAESLASEHGGVRVVDNPSGRTPIGLNAAIAASTGDVIIRVDGHAIIPKDYVATAVATLSDTGADNVGGIMDAEGITPFEQAVARAMTSRFGVGGAAFHVGGDEGPALTVYLGCFRRSVFTRVGGFDESMERAQDWELNLRIRQSGGLVWFTPALRVTYRPRSSAVALARQYLDYGRWRREVARRHPRTVSARYLAAPMTVVGMAMGVLLAIAGALNGHGWLVGLGLAAPLAYVLANLLASVMTARTPARLPWSTAMRLPLVYAVMHLSWGVGFLRGVRPR